MRQRHFGRPPAAHRSSDPPPTSAPSAAAAFTKSGDLMIHATLYADLPAEKIASLSLYELPYELAGVQYGVKANQKAPRQTHSPHRPPPARQKHSRAPAPAGRRASGVQVRPIFETDPELRFSTVDWKTAEDPSALALAACLLAETHGRNPRNPLEPPPPPTPAAVMTPARAVLAARRLV